MKYVYVKDRRVRLDPTRSIGKGGEADVFDVGGGVALKLFKPPSHPDYQGQPHEQQAAEVRITTHQQKLPELMTRANVLPGRVITPISLATNQAGSQILGYTMKFLDGTEILLRFTDRGFRQTGVENQEVVDIFCDLHPTVAGIHGASFVIGDFNDLNILVRGTEAWLIDADSFQFGPYKCTMFTQRFVDPLLCDPKRSSLMLARPHNQGSDWYSFAVMLMQCLLFVDPYGGIYRPKQKGQRIPHGARPLHRITVFNPEVKYPKPAIHFGVLPDELLHHFHLVFEKDQRDPFPLSLLQGIRWTTCPNCGAEHARTQCPQCAEMAPGIVKERIQVRGQVTATRIFQTDGQILFAAYQGGRMRWLYHQNGQYRREDQLVVFSGDLDRNIRYRIRGDQTLLGSGSNLVTLQRGQEPDKISVDTYHNLPIFDANSRRRYWLDQGRLYCDGQFGRDYLGDVLRGQTLFWVGPKFGFGFYRAGTLNIAFVFDAEHRGINDSVKIPGLRGQLVDSTCYFTKDRCWFLISVQEGGKIFNRCYLIRPDGTVEASAEAESGDDSWLARLRGKCAAGHFLMVATDEGLVRVERSGDQLVVSKEFPDTEPFVDAGCHLFPCKEGIYAVDQHEVRLLKISK